MNVAGIDYSSLAVDIVFVDHDRRRPPEWHRFPLVGNDAFDRSRSVADVMPGRSSVFWDDILAVGIEHPAGHHGVGPLLRVQGAVLGQIPARMLVTPWTPSGWRKAVGLPGNCGKPAVHTESSYRAAVTGTLTTEWPQDAHDAHLIALATRDAISTEKAA